MFLHSRQIKVSPVDKYAFKNLQIAGKHPPPPKKKKKKKITPPPRSNDPGHATRPDISKEREDEGQLHYIRLLIDIVIDHLLYFLYFKTMGNILLKIKKIFKCKDA